MKFATFDLEIAKDLPENQNWQDLGITCAAVAFSDNSEPIFWKGVPKMTQWECQDMFARLKEISDSGYTFVTWNGCAFDFAVLAEESGLVKECGEFALQHVDLMLIVTFTKGWYLSLQKALLGAGLKGKRKTVTLSNGTKLDEMGGIRVPQMWADGEYDAVLSYLKDDVIELINLIKVISKTKEIRWTSDKGKITSVPVPHFPTVLECFDIPEPDVSWMVDPPTRQQFVKWIPSRNIENDTPIIKKITREEIYRLIDRAIKDQSILDLSELNLSELDLNGANLSQANLRGANLTKARLLNTDLSFADLTEANLNGASLSSVSQFGDRVADLGDANLHSANLSGCDLTGVNLSGADLRNANLSKATMLSADLRGADLSGTDLSDAELSVSYEEQVVYLGLRNANLRGAKYNKFTKWPDGFYPKVVVASFKIAQEELKKLINIKTKDLRGLDLRKVNLSGAELFEAILFGSDLSDANLSRAILGRANLIGAILKLADLSGADLCGTDLREADLHEANLSKARYNEFTKWPDGFDPKAAGAIFVK